MLGGSSLLSANQVSKPDGGTESVSWAAHGSHEPEEAGPMAITSSSDKLLLCYQTFDKVNQKRTSFTSGNSSNQPQVRRHKKHSDIFFKVLRKGRTRYSFRKAVIFRKCRK